MKKTSNSEIPGEILEMVFLQPQRRFTDYCPSNYLNPEYAVHTTTCYWCRAKQAFSEFMQEIIYSKIADDMYNFMLQGNNLTDEEVEKELLDYCNSTYINKRCREIRKENQEYRKKYTYDDFLNWVRRQ